MEQESFAPAPYECVNNREQNLNFYRLTRLHDEPCTVATRIGQSVGQGAWKIAEREHKTCEFDVVERSATDEVVVQYRDGYGVAGRVIDVESSLKNQPEQTNTVGALRVQARPFTTVPQMGRGRGNPQMESILQQSEFVRDRKDCATVSDKPVPHYFDDLVPHLAAHVTNPRNLVEEAADPTWIRGGSHSRLIVRDALQ